MESEQHTKNLYFNITNACNSACIFCASNSQSVVRHDLPTQEVLDAFVRLEVGQGDSVVLNGGEPTIHPGLRTILHEAKNRGASTTLFTNGRKLNRYDYAYELVDAGVERLSIALHGSSATTHDRLTCRPGSFEHTLRGIKNAFAIRERTGLPRSIELKLLANRVSLAEWPSIAELILGTVGIPDRILLSGLIISKSVLAARSRLIPTTKELSESLNETIRRLSHFPGQVMLWGIPHCLLNAENAASLHKTILVVAPSFNSNHDFYFDPNYPKGIQFTETSSASAQETPCSRCDLPKTCAHGRVFMEQIHRATGN